MGLEHPEREGAPPNDGPFEGEPGPSTSIDADAPSGMPEGEPDDVPLGVPRDPDPDASPMPGLPNGDPPDAG